MTTRECPRCGGQGRVTYAESLSGLLKMLREERAASFREVAQETGVSVAHLHCMEAGKSTNPTFEIIQKLAKYYGVPLEHFAAALDRTEVEDGK